jgi:hypothetical protein
MRLGVARALEFYSAELNADTVSLATLPRCGVRIGKL